MTGPQPAAAPEAQPASLGLETFAAVVRAATLTRYTAHSCIETLRVGIEAGRYFGLHIVAVPVRVVYATRDWWAAPDKSTAPGWSAGVTGSGEIFQWHGTDRWDGHLCGYLPRRGGLGVFIDFSNDQYHRPARGLVVDRPLVFAVTRDQLRAGVQLDYSANVVCHYTETADRVWCGAPAWRGHASIIRACAGQAIRLLREGGS